MRKSDGRRWRLLAATVAGALMLGAAATVPNEPAGQAVGVDPTTLLLSMCRGSSKRAAALKDRIELAMRQQPGRAAAVPPMPLLDGLSAVRMRVTTRSSQAQRYFDQGLALTYGFNHEGAVRSFRAAQALDPACAMCAWGEGYALGPNINAAMDPDALPQALAAVRRATRLASGAAPHERALIAALGRRYSNAPGIERPALDRAYADAMRAVAARFPANDEVAVLAAEAVMDTQPWDYWEADRRTPKAAAGWAVATVERVLARSPDHAQAIHLYIHLVEASGTPERAEAAADRLARPLAPGAGHLVHMPAHLYYRLGRFKDSIRANVAAARADEAYLRASGDRGAVRFGYYPHNVHFIVTSAQMAGDRNTVLAESARLERLLDVDTALKLPWVQAIYAAPYFAHAQFGSPREVLALSAPDARLRYVIGMWRYARATAHAARGDARSVEAELAELRRVRDGTDFKSMVDAGMPAPALLSLAEHVARGRLAFARGDFRRAAGHYRAAVAVEDGIVYMEPPFWYYPVRQSLGAALLRAGDPRAAEQTFMEALAQSPNNGWALYGLARAQHAQRDRAGERASRVALGRAWAGDPRWLRLERL